MHRRKIYFEKAVSIFGYIRDTVKQYTMRKKDKSAKNDLESFAGMWSGRDISQESIRENAWERLNAIKLLKR